MLDAELFYELLVGEMSATQGDFSNAVALLLEAARSMKSEQLFRRAAELAMQSRSGQRAMLVATEWLNNFPTSREANRYGLQTLLALNRTSESLPYLRREVQTTSQAGKQSMYLGIAQLYSRVSDKALAAAVVEEALQDDLKSLQLGADAWATVGHLRLMAKQKELAVQAVQHAYEIDPQRGATALLALELMESGEASVEHMVQEYLSASPSPVIQMAYVRVLMGQNRLAEAQSQVQDVLLQDPEFADAWFSQARLQAQNREWKAALRSLGRFETLASKVENAAERDRALGQAYLMGARVSLQQDEPLQALEWLAKMPRGADPLEVSSLKALAFARQGKLPYGRALIRAVPAQGKEQEMLKRRAEINLLREADAPQEAYLLQLTLYEQNQSDPDIAYETALLAERAGKLDAMERILRKLIARNPDHQHALNALGYSLAERGIRLQEARKLIEAALRLAPGDPFITDSLGWLEFRVGNLAQAQTLLEKAYAERDDVEIGAHLGEVLWNSGEKERALRIWRDGLLRDARNETLRNTLKRLNVQP